MAINKKAIRGSGAIKLRDVLSSTDGATVNLVEKWVGPYAELRTKQLSIILSVKGTSLIPTAAGEGELTITQEQELTGEARPPTVVTTEVLWQELRQPLETFWKFNSLDADAKRKIRAAAEDPENTETFTDVALKLYEKIRAGNDEIALYVPLVRRTTTNVAGNVGSGSAGYRDEPPVSIAGTWEFLKTADERRKEGRRFDQIEEWTGARVWDPDLYDATP